MADIPLEKKIDPELETKATPCPNPYCSEGHVYGVDMGDVNLGHGPCERCDGQGYLDGSEED